MIEKYCYNIFFINHFGRREDEDKRMVKLDYSSFSRPSFLGYIIKNQHIHFLVYGHSSWSTFGLHVVRGRKTL
jgi:hypothetical protein